MSSMYALLVTKNYNCLCYSFCQIVFIMFRSYKYYNSNSVPIANHPQCSMCVPDPNLKFVFLSMFNLHNYSVADFQFPSSREAVRKPNIQQPPLCQKRKVGKKRKEKIAQLNSLSVHCVMVSKRWWVWEKLEGTLPPLPHTQYEPPVSVY